MNQLSHVSIDKFTYISSLRCAFARFIHPGHATLFHALALCHFECRNCKHRKQHLLNFNWGPRGQLAATFLGVWRQAIQCRRHQARVEALSRKDLAGRLTKRHTVTERWEMRTIVPICFPELPLHRCIIKFHQPLLTKLNITSEMRTEKRDGIGSYLTSMICNDLNKYPCHSRRQLPQHIVAKGSGRGSRQSDVTVDSRGFTKQLCAIVYWNAP